MRLILVPGLSRVRLPDKVEGLREGSDHNTNHPSRVNLPLGRPEFGAALDDASQESVCLSSEGIDQTMDLGMPVMRGSWSPSEFSKIRDPMRYLTTTGPIVFVESAEAPCGPVGRLEAN